MMNLLPIPRFYEAVRGDLTRHTSDEFNWLRAITYLRRPSFSAVFLHRLASSSVRKGTIGKMASMVFTRVNMILHCCEIAPEASIGPGFIMPHTLGIVIGVARIGSNATIMHNTTIGRKDVLGGDGSNPDEYPILGDDVVLAPGAVVLGSIKVGNHAMVGANSVLMQDVPDRGIAVGVPARILEKRRED